MARITRGDMEGVAILEALREEQRAAMAGLEERLVRLADEREAGLQAQLSALTQRQVLDREGAQLAFLRLDEAQARAAAAAAEAAAESKASFEALMQHFKVGGQQAGAGARPST